MTKYNTNLAAEFYVLSMLYRMGADASLTLGNKKAVDILVANEGGTITTVEVKGIQKKYDWPTDNIRFRFLHRNIKLVNQWIPLQEFEPFQFFDPNKVAAEHRFYMIHLDFVG